MKFPIWTLLIISILLPQDVRAATTLDPIFPTTSPEFKSVVEERVYFFTVRTYDPPVAVTPLATRSEASFDNPENSAITHLSAMVAGDYDWWLSTWSKTSHKMMTERDKKAGRSPDFWKEAWRKVFSNRTIELTQRVETGDYVIIAFKLISKSNPKSKEIQSELVLKKFNQKWLGTQDLNSDPVLLGWKHPERRLRFIIRNK